MQKNKDKWPHDYLSWKRWAHSPNETIHITLVCAVHLHGHQNNVMAFMKSSIFADIRNDVKFCHYTYYSTNDIWSHYLSHQVNKHRIGNKDLVLTDHVEINL